MAAVVLLILWLAALSSTGTSAGVVMPPTTSAADAPAIDVSCQVLRVQADAIAQMRIARDKGRDGVSVTAEQVRDLVVAARTAAEGRHVVLPRITVLSGKRASAAVCTRRQYVSGYRLAAPADGSASHEPETSSVEEGIRLDIEAVASDDFGTVTVTAALRVSTLVRLAEEPWGGSPAGQRLMVQKPIVDVREARCSGAGRDNQMRLFIMDGEAGADIGHVWLLLVRPTVVALRMEKDESER